MVWVQSFVNQMESVGIIEGLICQPLLLKDEDKAV
jgi:hypothetical protein